MKKTNINGRVTPSVILHKISLGASMIHSMQMLLYLWILSLKRPKPSKCQNAQYADTAHAAFCVHERSSS